MTNPGPVQALEAFLDERIAAGDFPGAVWGVWDRGAPGGWTACGARGNRAIEPEVEPATFDTIYDLASLTKPLVTATLLLQLMEEGILSLEDPISRWIPEMEGTDKASIRLDDLASHQAGLPPWMPLYAGSRDLAGYLRSIAGVPLVPAPVREAVYSDLGYILLGEAVSRAGGERLDRLFERRVAAVLGLTATRFLPPAEWSGRIAPTERDNATERRMVAGLGLQYDGWRSGMIRGQVHDVNAWTLGGVAGHAGLFGTAEEVILIAREYLQEGRGLLGAAPLAAARECRTRAGERRSIGWQMADSPRSAGDGVLPPAAFGHTGFTGTSLWLDPGAGRACVLLTNRVHPAAREMKPNRNMNSVRREFHRLAAQVRVRD